MNSLKNFKDGIMAEKNRSFWTSIPGILSGIAVVITASTGFYLAIKGKGEPKQKKEIPDIVIPKLSPSGESSDLASYYSKWPVLLKETFTESNDTWHLAPYSEDENKHIKSYEIKRENGKYRFDLSFQKTWGNYKMLINHDPVENFYAAIDLRFTEFKQDSDVQASFYFGSFGNARFFANVTSKKFFSLSFQDGNKDVNVVNWVKIDTMNPDEFNRLTIAVLKKRINIYMNGVSIIENIKVNYYNGGYLGLQVGGMNEGLAVVDFDNFELRSPD